VNVIKDAEEQCMDALLAVWVYAPVALLCVAAAWYCVFEEKGERCVCDLEHEEIEGLWYTGR